MGIVYKDSAGNTLRIEKGKLLARNARGKLVGTQGLKSMIRRATKKRMKLKSVRIGKKQYLERR